MRVVLQRVSRASVAVDGREIGAIDAGLLILVGVADGDGEAQAEALAAKIAGLRIFADAEGRFNHSVRDVGGSALVVSQFTLHADVRKGRRPSFTTAARPEIAEPLVEYFAESLHSHAVPVETGAFGAMMSVELVNDGPFTIVIDSADLERPRRG
ncbi:MAG: D-tyrosyl-tRNA(Tyr) deacylase [Chloroflexi bacterium]|nr:D-tyrosyl-tRNA(Tyr) deacylase [Chloroflexota bacterium]MYD16038.1 D-tyrosyl-tRNA(Tyr) deacylase [Chloroflexota bacterium]MYJ01911.1 D-tyrosyl-tRNA(Tyr) deacylase [Chloroflexota bacterium]